jgi:hypothetical protein
MQRALALMGNNAQMLEPLIFIAARYSPARQKLKVVDEDIAHRDFTAAMTTINSLTGIERDAGLARLAKAQAQAGQYKPAFGAANAIGDPSNRVDALIAIMNAGGGKTP